MWDGARRLAFTLACLTACLSFALGADNARAQSAALAATAVDVHRLPPESQLTLRPEQGLEALAAKVARVLALRTGTVVEVGSAPPPGLLEAVPAGHIALAREEGQVRLVLGAAFGRSFESVVQLADGQGESDVRSVALAVETLRDRAIEARAQLEATQNSAVVAADDGAGHDAHDGNDTHDTHDSSFVPTGLHDAPRDDGAGLVVPPFPDHRLKPVQPYFFLQAYGGASAQSTGPRMGIGSGGGLCVLGYCFVLAVEYPIPFALQARAQDIRYRYTTFTSTFHARPISFGRFTPGASIGLLSRIGNFERDMGLPQNGGLDTDLGVRGTLEAAYEVMHAVDAVGELGLDYALDRYRIGHGDVVAYRGQRETPWFQAAIRVRL